MKLAEHFCSQCLETTKFIIGESCLICTRCQFKHQMVDLEERLPEMVELVKQASGRAGARKDL